MKKYINPEMIISKFNTENIVTIASGEVTPKSSLDAANEYLTDTNKTVVFGSEQSESVALTW